MTSTLSASSNAPLRTHFATHVNEIRAGQQLRYTIFAEEMGAKLHSRTPQLDDEPLDDYCQHLLVLNANDEVVGYTRLLTADQAPRAGGFYSAREFDLTALSSLKGRFVEMGRTCIHRDYRQGSTIATLWGAVAQFIKRERADYLMGCASIPLAEGIAAVRNLCEQLSQHHGLPVELRTPPRLPLPHPPSEDHISLARLPPLLKAYLRIGAKIGGDPCWDPDFEVADVLILLETAHIDGRYARHFLQRLTP